jgi:predicted ArsR family transcriptional regulator
MTIKEKLRRYMANRKTPVTAAQIAERMACHEGKAREAMNELIKEGVVKEVLVACKNRYVKGII